MRVTMLGHAGLAVDGRRSRLLVDPWLSPFGAFQASWFPYPDNDHLSLSSLLTPTAVVVSHEHLDHLDPWFLGQLAPDIPVVVPRYPSPALRRKLAACGRGAVVELPAWEWFEAADGIRVLFVTEDSPMNHDAAVVVQADGHTLVDLNDARLSPAQLRAVRKATGGTIDVLTAQAAGASWHPMCYELPAERRRMLSRQKRLAKFRYLAAAIRAAEPEVAVPFAGPPCFLDPELFEHNREMEGGVFPDQHQAAEWLAGQNAGRVAVLLPGDAWDAGAGAKDPDPRWHGFAPADRWPYLEQYAARRAEHVAEVLARHPSPSTSLWDGFRAWAESILELSSYFNGRIGMRVGFEVSGQGGGTWAVDFRPGLEGVDAEMGDCQYRYRLDSRWLPPVLDGSVPWEDFLLSLRFRAWRSPDVHNEHLLGLLKFADAGALEAVERYETSTAAAERMVVEVDGRTYSVARTCPHAGADLREASEVLPGRVLRCLNHYYEFDLDTGRCLNGACPPLDVVQVHSPPATVGR